MTSAVRARRSRKWPIVVAASVLLAVAGIAIGVVMRLNRQLQACTIGGRAAQCGRFAVPENPARPDGRKIKLNVAVVKATGGHPKPDPVMWLAGWGGAGVTDDAAGALPALRRVNIDRDLIFIDQRGTGGTKLVCSMPRGWGQRAVAPAAITAAARHCAASIGPNLRYYTSAVAVDDFDRIRRELGYDKVNLYGASYGVTTGLIYLLRHGSHVRSAVFDSGSLLDVRIFERAAKGSQRALDMLFRRCARDTACSTAYPHLRQEFKALMARAAAKPISIPGESQKLTSEALAGAVGDAISYTPGKSVTPRLIHLVSQGHFGEAAKIVKDINTPSPKSELAYMLLIQCSEPWASWRPNEIKRAGAGSYLMPVELRNAQAMAAVCKGMPKGVAPANIGQRVHSSVPVLFLVGDEDGADPPANVAHARRELPNSRTVIFPRAGHGQLGTLCAQNLIATFVAGPNPRRLDTLCALTAVQEYFAVTP
jgi:pimeloyl-ACP methyl ester carboxylesterase